METKITHKSIAKAAGVSQATVSKALSDSREVNAETAEYIRMLADEMGYFRRRKERKQRTAEVLFPHVAILVPEIVSWSYAYEVTALQATIESIGGTVDIHVTGFDETKWSIVVDRLNREDEVDCILSLEGFNFSGHSHLPIGYLCVATAPTKRNFLVLTRTDDVIIEAVQYLWNLGHRKIGFLGEQNTLNKKKIFTAAMAACGGKTDESLIITSNARFEQVGHEGVRALHLSGKMPTALITAYDEVAIGAIQELKSFGYRIPEDVSVIGFNDVPHAVYQEPPLTTVRLDMQARNRETVRLIMEAIEGVYTGARTLMLPAKLIIRESCAEPRK